MRDCIDRVEFIFQRDIAIVGDEACFVRCGDHNINRYIKLMRFSSARPITSLDPVVTAFKSRGFMIDQPPIQIYEPEAAKPFEMIGGPEYAGRQNARLHYHRFSPAPGMANIHQDILKAGLIAVTE